MQNTNDIYQGLDSNSLNKVSKVILFIANHIRQSGDVVLADRIDAALYDLLLAAHTSEMEYNRVLAYVMSLISIATSKEHIREDVVTKVRVITRDVFYKRQVLNLEEILSDTESVRVENARDVEIKVLETASAEMSEVRGLEIKKTLSETRSEKIEKLDNKNTHNSRKMVFEDKRQSSRRQEILAQLSGTPVSIKDIAVNVLGCSEKTIQRELNALVDDNIIKRIGEKRWSKYILR
jgi:hypothetical protein